MLVRQPLRISLEHNLAVGEEEHPVAHALDLHHIVRGPQQLTGARRGELAKPGRDPRQQFEVFAFQAGVEQIEDLKPGMKLPGIVTNVTALGAFVDIGVHQDGLVHVSQVSDCFVKDPAEVVKFQQKVMVTVTEVDLPRKRIALSMKAAPTLGPAAAGKTPPGPGRPPARVPQVKPQATDWFTEALNRSKKA